MFRHPITVLMIATISLSWLCPSAQAGNTAYNDKIQPKIELPEALALANKALGKDTKSYYCISAHLERVAEDCWIIEYAPASGAKCSVEVDFDKHISSPPDADKVRL